MGGDKNQAKGRGGSGRANQGDTVTWADNY